MHKAGVFSDDDFKIATNPLRKVKTKEEIAEKEQKKILFILAKILSMNSLSNGKKDTNEYLFFSFYTYIE